MLRTTRLKAINSISGFECRMFADRGRNCKLQLLMFRGPVGGGSSHSAAQGPIYQLGSRNDERWIEVHKRPRYVHSH